MTKEYPRKLFYSRLVKLEEKRGLKKAFLFIILTLALVTLILFFGLPLLIRLAVFFAEIKGPGQPTEKVDILPPSPPRLNSLPEFSQQDFTSLSGFAEPSSIIEVFLNNVPVGTITASPEGTFHFEKINLTQERNEIYALATDKAGNKSQSSSKISLIFDNTPPELSISEPPEGAIFTGEKKRKIKISGQTEKEASLTINERMVILDQEGKFQTDFLLFEGENLLKIIATDRAGNQTEKVVKVIFNL